MRNKSTVYSDYRNPIIHINYLSESDPEEGPASCSKTPEPETEDSGVEKIRKYLAQKLGIHDSEEESEPPSPNILTELSIDGIAEFIKSTGCRKVITMAGAGISTCR